MTNLSWQQSIGIDESHLTYYQDDSGQQYLLHSEIIEALSLLFQQAKEDDVALSIVSSFRSFQRQLNIWNNKWNGNRKVLASNGEIMDIQDLSDSERFKAIAHWSALPGLSRHHWGTDLDIFSTSAIQSGHKVTLTPDEFSINGPCYSLECWLKTNLNKYGFYRPYEKYQNGVAEEPWHISHFNSSNLIMQNFNFEACKAFIEKSEIQSRDFILKNYDLYIQQYFLNICEAEDD